MYPQAIKQFQIVQNDYFRFRVKFVLDKDYNFQEICELFLNSIWQSELKQAVYDFEIVDALFPNDNGKLAYFTNNIKDGV